MSYHFVLVRYPWRIFIFMDKRVAMKGLQIRVTGASGWMLR